MKLKLTDLPVLYINLDRDIERRLRLENFLGDLGFKNITRVPGKETAIGKEGCAYAHAEALSMIEPPFILFEDDCVPLSFLDEIEIPDDADALYLGVSSWGRMNSHSGPFNQYEQIDNNLLRVYNMVGAHAILYLTEEYTSLCRRIAEHGYNIQDHHDIGFAEVQKYFNVYSVDDPMFFQTSSAEATNKKLTSYPTEECFMYNKRYWLPLRVY
jgi:hypothetical protein